MTTSRRSSVAFVCSLLLAALVGSNLVLFRPATASEKDAAGTITRPPTNPNSIRRGIDNPLPPRTFAAPFNLGDVFSGVGGGKIRQTSNTGTLVQELNTTSGSTEETGMGFDAAGNLYTTNFSASNMSKFDNTGVLVQHPWGSGFNQHPESVAPDGSGHIYVGQADGSRAILKFDLAGTLLGSFNPLTESRGTDWIDLAADTCTMFYTSEGFLIKRFNVCGNVQLSDFATLPTRPAYALRIRPNGEVLVAATSACYRLDSNGNVIQSYPVTNYGETSFFFALNLDPDDESFWTAGFSTGNIYRIRISDGALITQFQVPIVVSLAGLAVYGEIRVGRRAPRFDATITPQCGSVLTVEATKTLTFTVKVADEDTLDIVTLSSGPLPPGATMALPLPQAGNPVSSTFSWTPTAGDTGMYFVDFTATDNHGNSSVCRTEIQVTPRLNQAPDCSGAAPSVAELWPPNHRYVSVNIIGVTDLEGDSVTITITGVTQDEPVNTRGDGSTCPDARFSGGTAEVRAERTGDPNVPGHGRVYAIAFLAEDGQGGSCRDTVSVCVPHDQKPGHLCIDDGQNYDATACVRDSTPSGRMMPAEARVVLSAPRLAGNTAVIEYAQRAGGNVHIAVYDMLGRRMATLEDSYQSVGTHRASWNVADSKPGIYFVRVNAAGTTVSRTLLILK